MKIIKMGERQCVACGTWECLYCRTVYEVDRDTPPQEYIYHEDQHDGEALEVPCIVCEEDRWLQRAKI